MNPILGQSALVVYALMLGAGGYMGYRKAGSKPSLIAGSISAVLACAAAVLSIFNTKLGLWLGAALGVVMLAFFLPRFVKTKKMMPAGLMAIASMLIVGLLVVNLLMLDL
jgi:uncharacterized membrane protein (UPF0136 family)